MPVASIEAVCMNNHFTDIYLEDKRIRLVPVQETDWEALYAVAADPLIWEQHPDTERYRSEVFRAFFDSAVQCGSAVLIIDKKSGEVIGSSRYYDVAVQAGPVAIGYTFLARNYWGGKFNAAVKKLMLDHAFAILYR